MLKKALPLPLVVAGLAACQTDAGVREALELDLPLDQAAPIRPADKLSSDLRRELETSSSEQRLRVLVEFSLQLNLHALGTRLRVQGVGRLERRDSAVTALRRVAGLSEARLQPVLERLSRRGWLDSYRSLSIVNGLVVVATPRAIRELARQDAVASVALETREGAAILAQPRATLRAATGAASSWALGTIGAPTAWQRGLDGSGVVVGIIDAGASGVHEQLRGNYRGGRRSWHDAVGERSQPQDAMTGHGTQILSAAVGKNLAGRMLGVAPGAEWIACGGLPGGRYNNIAIFECADWMLNTGQPDVLINAWVLPDEGCDSRLQRIVNAWRAAEIFPVFAAGNDGPDPHTDRSPANYVELYPGAASALSVGGLAAPDSAFARSSRGPNSCDGSTYPAIVAPAFGVLAAFPLTESSYILSEGTSIAAGLVAGAAALLLQRHPKAAVNDLEEALRSSAIDLGPAGPDDVFGSGRIYLPAALDSLGRIFDQNDSPKSSKEAPRQR